MTLDEALRVQETQVDDLLKAANRYVGVLKLWKKACQIGHVGNMQKAMQQAGELAPALTAPTQFAAQNWTFNVQAYLAGEEWRRELQAAASEKYGMRVLEEGDMLSSSRLKIL